MSATIIPVRLIYLELIFDVKLVINRKSRTSYPIDLVTKCEASL